MMNMSKSEKRSVYVCSECKNHIEILYTAGGPIPVCCGKEMDGLTVQTADPVKEKHVPYIERDGDRVLVKVGKEAPHPMTPDHHIVYIEICADGMIMRRYLKPGDAPEACFRTKAKKVVARELCNVHRLWGYEE